MKTRTHTHRLLKTTLTLLLLGSGMLHAGFDMSEIQDKMPAFWKAHMSSKKKNDEWYIRLNASAPTEDLTDRSNILGQLSDSKEGYDSHDLPEMLPGYAPYLTLYFPHEAWGRKDTLYASDYRSVSRQRRIVWSFTVKSDDAQRSITLGWDQPVLPSSTRNKKRQQKQKEKLMKRMWLKEVSTGTYYPAYEEGKARSYTFEMGGEHTKSFEWIYDRTGKSRRIYRLQQRGVFKPKKPASGHSEKTKAHKQRKHAHELDMPPGMGER
ncbi:hypothetical protein [Sulfurovum sp.]|uniref:hypothetical protein n=1 Tax=Sulfurovum sp. TaxID=1969726 RepID=UPI00262CB97E|nr:hypothetical protein [Sulfurovum sp.]